MQLRHISPRSSEWKDAMDEGMGGRGWERLAPEEREKLLQDRRDEDGDLSRAGPSNAAPWRRASGSGQVRQGLAAASASK
jgi:hypothetical protein